jgi:hypothetical protein
MRRHAFIALLMFWGSGSALAADPPQIPVSPELRKFLTDPDEEKIVKGQALHDWNNVVANCPAPTLEGANVVIGVAPTFDKAGKPVSGNWRVVSHLAGCGNARMFSLFYAAGPNGELRRIAMLPGTSVADPVLQRDALVFANTGMGKLTPPGCKDFKYLDTAFDGFGPPVPGAQPGRETRGWIEKWTVLGCGTTGIVKLYFTPDATGTAISAKLDETVKIAPR